MRFRVGRPSKIGVRWRQFRRSEHRCPLYDGNSSMLWPPVQTVACFKASEITFAKLSPTLAFRRGPPSRAYRIQLREATAQGQAPRARGQDPGVGGSGGSQ